MTTSVDNSPKLKWQEEEDGDYTYYRSQTLVEGEDHPYYWCGCHFAADDTKVFGLSLVMDDDDEMIINGEVAPVPLADAQAAAERHFARLLCRINEMIPTTPELGEYS